IDKALAEALPRRLGGGFPAGALGIIRGDILRLDLGELLRGLGASAARPARVIGNLPYNIATAVILRFLLERLPVRDLLVMVQREVAERILSPPDRRTYGSLSVLCQVYARPEPLLRLRPGSFLPRPKVESEVLRLTVRGADGGLLPEPGALSSLLQAAFGRRRKTLQNNLAALARCSTERAESPGAERLGAPGAADLIRKAGLDPAARAETVP